MNITFDTNVWRRLVNEEKPHLVEIKNKIRDGKIQAYICEITSNLEAIRRQKRAEFFENYKPKWTVHDKNRTQLEKAFGIKIISSCEAAQLC